MDKQLGSVEDSSRITSYWFEVVDADEEMVSFRMCDMADDTEHFSVWPKDELPETVRDRLGEGATGEVHFHHFTDEKGQIRHQNSFTLDEAAAQTDAEIEASRTQVADYAARAVFARAATIE